MSEIDYGKLRILRRRKITDLDDPIQLAILSTLEITLEDADESELRVCDAKEDEGLYLMFALEPTDATAHIRGVILYVDEKFRARVVCQSFPHTLDISVDEVDDADLTCDTVYSMAYEGTIMRMFNSPATGKWYLSTHKSIDGRASKWNGPPFGELFDELWGDEKEFAYDEYMREDRCYVFLVSHPQNRIVCKINTPSIRLVDVMGLTLGDECTLEKEHPYVGPKVSIQFSEGTEATLTDIKRDLKEYVRTMDWTEYTGIFCDTIHSDGMRICHKVIPDGYTLSREVRGNTPSIRMRYLQMYCVNDTDGMEALANLFPEHTDMFTATKVGVEVDVPAILCEKYAIRYEMGEYLRLSRGVYYILETVKRCKARDSESRSVEEIIVDILSRSTPSQLNALLKLV